MHLCTWTNIPVDGIPLTAVFYGFSDVSPGKSRTLPAYGSLRASRENATDIIPNWTVALPMKSAATHVTGICSVSHTGGKRCIPDAANVRSSGSILRCSNEKTDTDWCPFFAAAAAAADTDLLQFRS